MGHDIEAKLLEFMELPAETEWIEFKEAKSDFSFDKLGRYFSALSNEANLAGEPAGWLIFGVTDKPPRRIVGTKYRLQAPGLEKLKREIARRTNHQLTFRAIHELQHSGKRVLMFEIPAAPKGIPTTWDGVAFGRTYDSLGHLNLEEIERIRKQPRLEDWSAQICDSATLSDLDPNAIDFARERYMEKFPQLANQAKEWDDITFLNKAKVCINGQITRAAIILLGKSEAEHFLFPAIAHITWILRDSNGIETDYEHFGPPLILNVNGVFEKIRNHLLKHFYGFEILITPYVISHLKLTDLLQRWHYRFRDDDRIQVYLTNTLEPSEVHGLLPFLREITEESRIANQIKLQKPILVVMGNPPYAGESYNKGKWINDLLKKGYTRADGTKDDGYYKVDGKPLGEKNPKWLQDDYVKFIRYAQWKIEKNGEGIVGFITNHSYLDNPTFRGMRESLLQSFDRIYVLNLHGNALKKEKCPDGSKDENVFDIRQGVAVGIFIKNKKLGDKKVYYADLWGLREDKYYWLDRYTIDNVEWQGVKPILPYYFFIPKDTALEEEYNKFWKITDIFPINSVGIATARDHFTIKWTPPRCKQNGSPFPSYIQDVRKIWGWIIV